MNDVNKVGMAQLPVTSSGFHALLKNRAFLYLWGGQIMSQIADKVFFVLTIALLEKYQASAMRSHLMIAVTLPAILFGSLAGVAVDRFSKRNILVYCNFLRGGLTLLIPMLPKAFNVLLAIAFLESILTQFFAPAEQAAIPLLVERQNLLSANALFTMTMMGSLIVGFAIGEPILTWAEQFGHYGPELLTALGYLLATGLLALIPRETEDSGTQPQDQGRIRPWQDFQAGFQYLKKDRLVSTALIQLTILYSVFAALTILAIYLAEKIGLKPTQFGFLLAATGVGMLLGAGILGQWGAKFHHRPLPLIGFCLMSLVLCVFSFLTRIWLCLGLSIVLGIGAALVGVPMQTLIQEHTPEAMRGKVFGFQNNLVNIALSLPLAIAEPLALKFGLSPVLLSMSGLVVVGAIWSWQRSRQVLEDAI
jgi:MFS family permease